MQKTQKNKNRKKCKKAKNVKKLSLDLAIALVSDYCY